jgi:2-keto-4-pentenoate hydratase/2-oxohepta-3-ene-1,7-dioic acid hydratase in catechol pathway
VRLVSFSKRGRPTPGVLSEDGKDLIDLSIAAPAAGPDVISIIEGSTRALGEVRGALRTRKKGARRPASHAKLLAPIPNPRRNIFCVGKNYYEHAEEFHSSGYDASAGKAAIPEVPIYFTKSVTTITGPGAPVNASADKTRTVDYEVELAAVVGKGGRNIAKREAYAHVFGYTILDDVTSRDLQQRHKQWFLGKNFDTFAPMGPWLVTADEVGDVRKLQVLTWVNGELRQNASLKDLIFDIPTLISGLSKVMTLCPGDIIATGTPSGVGLGFDPPQFLKKGDVVTMEITGLGRLENPIV